jgi:hypothetical protein
MSYQTPKTTFAFLVNQSNGSEQIDRKRAPLVRVVGSRESDPRGKTFAQRLRSLRVDGTSSGTVICRWLIEPTVVPKCETMKRSDETKRYGAARRCSTQLAPKIAVAVAPVLSAGASAPVFGKALVGMVIEYVFRIAEPGARRKKSQLYTYQGYIKGIEVVNRGKKDEHALAVCLWPTTLVDGVFVEEQEEEACMLFANLYGKTGVSGWVVYKGKLEVDAAAEHSGAEVQDLDAKMDQAAIDSALLCAPITSG